MASTSPQFLVIGVGRETHRAARNAKALGDADQDVVAADSATIQDLRYLALGLLHREVVAVYPFRSALPRSLWRDLITGAAKTIVCAGYTSYFLWTEVPNMRGVLRRKVEQGAKVRFLLGDPDSDVTRERERIEAVPLTVSTRIRVTLDQLGKVGAQVETRLSDRHIATSVWVFDEDMIVSVHLADLLGHDSPTLHIRRRQDGGLYDRFRDHVDHLWEHARLVDS